VITEPVLMDTGPIVALLHRQDAHHVRCREQAAQLAGPVFTCWPVITEAAWLLRSLPGSLPRLLEVLADRDIACLHLESSAIPWLGKVATQFQDLSPQLADLSLLYLAEHHRVQYVFTLDRRDFSVYRTMSGDSLQLLPDSI
jgi:predicted nucleic acid-binding protein